MKKYLFVLIAIFSIFFVSCKNNITVKSIAGGAQVDFFVNFEEDFLHQFSAVLGCAEDFSANSLFNDEEIKNGLEGAGFEKVKVSVNDDVLEFSGFVRNDEKNLLVSSGVLTFTKDGNAKLSLNAKNLQNLYNVFPQDFKNCIDMLMAPTFSKEEMSDDEYAELIASVYGEELSKSVLKSELKITMINLQGKKSVKNLSALRILNLIDNLII